MAQAKTFSAQELRRVLDYTATRMYAARNRAIVLMQHLSGLRVGECAALTWADVVTDTAQVRDEIHLRADQTKRGHARTVFVSERLRKELQRYILSTQQRAGDWAFFYTQQKPRRGLLPTRWQNTCDMIAELSMYQCKCLVPWIPIA